MKLFHLLRIGMAAGAGGRNIIPVDSRLFTGRRNDVMGVAVAVLAGGRLIASLMQGDSMRALQVDFRFNVVAVGAGDLFQGRVVHRIFHIVVAAGALVVGMHGFKKKAAVYKGLRILFSMAFQTFGIADLSVNRQSTDEQPEGRQSERVV